MRRLRDYLKKWKSNPLRVFIPCRKCGKDTAELYQQLEGGLIKARCFECNNPLQPFSKDDFKFLPPYPCPECGKEMKPEQLKIDYANACYTCKDCDVYIRLADLLPGFE